MFKRKIYDKLLQWKKDSDGKTALLIEGARRIGKSTIVESFGRNEYKSYIIIDFSIVSKNIRELFEEEKIEDMLEYIEMYATSTESPNKTDKTSKKARELYKYLSNNRAGLLPYQKRGIEIPHAPKGMKYKNMGVQENQNCTIITLRMKHRRMRWSVCGANNMAKLLYRRENDELIETIERYTDGFVMTMEMQKVVKNLTAAKAPKRDGKGSGYIDAINHPVPLYGAMMTASRKAFKRWLQ